MCKLCFIDIETTGVNREIHEIHQISGMIVIDDVIREVFDFKIRPSEKCVYDPQALEVNNLTVDDLQSPERLSHLKAYQLFSNILQKYVNKFNKSDKFFFVGYNAHFDKDRVYDWFIANGDKYFFSFFWGNHIDVMVLSTMRLMNQRPKMENFKLTTVAKYLNITVPEDIKLPDGTNIQDKQAHDAIFDILLTKALFDFMQTGNTQITVTEKTEQGLSDLSSAFLPDATASITDASVPNTRFRPLGKSGYPVLDWDSPFPFKKYRGHTVQDIFEVDVQYLNWCLENTAIEFTQEIIDDIKLHVAHDAKFQKEESSKSRKIYSGNDRVIDHFIESQDIDSFDF